MKQRTNPVRCAVVINTSLAAYRNQTMVQLAERTGLSLRDTRRTVRQSVVSGHLRLSKDPDKGWVYHLPYLGTV